MSIPFAPLLKTTALHRDQSAGDLRLARDVATGYRRVVRDMGLGFFSQFSAEFGIYFRHSGTPQKALTCVNFVNFRAAKARISLYVHRLSSLLLHAMRSSVAPTAKLDASFASCH
jgi:hypothetical protein